jgi:hypothetical protein
VLAIIYIRLHLREVSDANQLSCPDLIRLDPSNQAAAMGVAVRSEQWMAGLVLYPDLFFARLVLGPRVARIRGPGMTMKLPMKHLSEPENWD